MLEPEELSLLEPEVLSEFPDTILDSEVFEVFPYSDDPKAALEPAAMPDSEEPDLIFDEADPDLSFEVLEDVWASEPELAPEGAT